LLDGAPDVELFGAGIAGFKMICDGGHGDAADGSVEIGGELCADILAGVSVEAGGSVAEIFWIGFVEVH